MSLVRTVVVAVLIVGSDAGGCNWRPKHRSFVQNTAIFQPDFRYGEFIPQPASEPDSPPEYFPPSVIDSLPNVDTFTIEFHVYDAYLPDTCDSTTPVGQDVSASQSVTIISDAAKDDDGLLDGSIASSGGREGSRPLLNRLFTRDDTPYQLIVDDPIRLGPHKVAVRLRTSTYKKRGTIFASSTDGNNWSLTVTIDGEFSEPRYAIVGGWSGAHAAELEINGTQVYRHEAAIVKKTPPEPANGSTDKPQTKKKEWEWWDLFKSPERSVTEAGISKQGLLRKPRYVP